jgi:hypothetical protein
MTRAAGCAVALAVLVSCQRDLEGPLPTTAFRHPMLAQQAAKLDTAGAQPSYVAKQERVSRTLPFEPAERASIPAVTTLPGRADGALEIAERTGLSVRVSVKGARDVPAESAGAFVVYPKAFGAGALLAHVTEDGVEDFVELPVRPARALVEYEVALSDQVAGLRLVDRTLEFLDAKGNPRLRMSPPTLSGSARRTLPAAVAVEGCAVDRNPLAPWGRPVVNPGARRCQVRLSWEAGDDFYPAVLDPIWTTTGDLATARFGHSMVKIGTNGLMMTCGGYDVALASMASCELYDEVTALWSATSPMPRARANFGMAYAAPVNPGPRVVAVGGEASGATLAAIDLYNPASGNWAPGPSMSLGRAYLTATPLPNNSDFIVILGGQYDGGGCAARSASIDRYVFSTNTVTPVGNMATGRALHNATPIIGGASAGIILVTGGVGTCCPATCFGGVQAAELIDTSGVTASPAGLMLQTGRQLAATFALPSGQVRIAGGLVDTVTSQSFRDSELYTPGSGFGDLKSFPGFAQGGGWGGFGILSNGNLVVAGGGDNSVASASTAATFVYDGTTWAASGALSTPKRGMATGTTPAGKVMVAGGADVPSAVLTLYRRTELFDLNPIGTPCTGKGLCASQLCVDNVCCNTACAGACDSCNLSGTAGTCTFNPSTTVCNASLGLCDPAENCTGTSATCPADVKSSAGTVCRTAAAGGCDVAESCDGTSVGCPADGFAATSVVCRPAVAGVCDVAENCTGASAACPADAFAAASVVCRPAAAGGCDVAENCTGSSNSCPSDSFAATSVVCRPAAAGGCDVAENCTGASAACPADGFASATTVCRPDAGLCDVTELCSGASADCGADVLRPPGAVCNTYVCTGADAGCPTTCDTDAGCAPSAACLNHLCVGVLPPGRKCTLDAECLSGFCTDGVCCTARCDAACASCNLPGAAGTCTPDPHGTPGVPSCAPYVCDGATASCPTRCTTTDDCVAGLSCVDGVCGSVAPNGHTCSADSECASGFCADGVCCSGRCGGACDSCNLAGSVGTCAFSPAGSSGDPTCSPYVCSGTSASCPTACTKDDECRPESFCENKLCSSRTRGHIGFGCGCGAADFGAAPWFALLVGLAVGLGRRRAEVRR